MSHPNFIIQYVNDPLASAGFYQTLLGQPAIEASPGFALFALESGVMLGLWARQQVEPSAGPTQAVSQGELAFALENNEEVQARYSVWKERGLKILQTPVQLDFGYTFVAADPDGHRLRVFAATN